MADDLDASMKCHASDLAYWFSEQGRADSRWREKALSLLGPLRRELEGSLGVAVHVVGPIGSRSAFPVGGFLGMTYRQWLIGEALEGRLASGRSPMGAAAHDAIEAADAVIARLDEEIIDEKTEGKGDAEAP